MFLSQTNIRTFPAYFRAYGFSFRWIQCPPSLPACSAARFVRNGRWQKWGGGRVPASSSFDDKSMLRSSPTPPCCDCEMVSNVSSADRRGRKQLQHFYIHPSETRAVQFKHKEGDRSISHDQTEHISTEPEVRRRKSSVMEIRYTQTSKLCQIKKMKLVNSWD